MDGVSGDQNDGHNRRVAMMAAVCLFTAFCVVMLGAYVRLSDAGLGCPDWPGCYGKLLGVPDRCGEIVDAQAAYPDRPFDKDKAWKEVSHRYLAGVLGLLIVALTIIARRSALAWALLGAVLFQAALGMWTVTLLLQPLIVVLHLLGGMVIVAMLTWLWASHRRQGAASPSPTETRRSLRRWGGATLAVLFAQIALGGWVSANYAALACPDFPTCQAQWWPTGMDFKALWPSWGESGVNYEFGRLDNEARTAIHVTHRLGALIAAIVTLAFAYRLLKAARPRAATLIAGLLATQIALGISNVVFALPLWIAVAHNGTAAALLAATTAALARQRQGGQGKGERPEQGSNLQPSP